MTDDEHKEHIATMTAAELLAYVIESPEHLTDPYYRDIGAEIRARHMVLILEEHLNITPDLIAAMKAEPVPGRMWWAEPDMGTPLRDLPLEINIDGMLHFMGGGCCASERDTCPKCGRKGLHKQGVYHGMAYACDHCDAADFKPAGTYKRDGRIVE